MSRSEKFEKDWFKLEQEIIYTEKALNTGIFGGGYYYDFYQEKEAKSAEEFVLKGNMNKYIAKTNMLKINNGFADLYRLTFVLDNEKIDEDYPQNEKTEKKSN